jgi:hypothetical protein
MAKLLALAYPLAVFTLFLPFLTFFHLNLTQIQALNNKNNPKHPFQKGEGATIYKKSKHKKQIITADRTC